ncbi:MAG: DUF4160 domain-containing protein [Gemmatimonadales bacterium]
MPEISRFYGLVIQMYAQEHSPPHFHVRCGKCTAAIRLAPIGLLAGQLPPKALAMAVEWATLHAVELRANWDRLRRGEPPVPVPPLR